MVATQVFPSQLPPKYHLDYGQQVQWFAVAAGDKALRATIESGPMAVSLQDNRKFGANHFEAQVRMGTSILAAGQPADFRLRLAPAQSQDIQATYKAWLSRKRADRITSGDARPLAIGTLRPRRETVPVYGKFEVTFDLAASYQNPFDPREIDVVGVFVAPDGTTTRVPAFLYQEYEQSLIAGTETLTPVGQPVWKVRFAPTKPGRYRYRIEARDRSGRRRSPTGTFKAVAAESPGFIRRSRHSPWYLQFDSEDSYFPVGENLCWASEAGLYDYQEWLPALGEAGANFARIWLVPWNLGLEWKDMEGWPARGQFYGAGRYSLDNAWRIDHLLQLAQRHDVYLMLCLGTYGELLDRKGYFGEQLWHLSPYNAANGGPCDSPAEFWTSQEARRLYKQRLRYMVARYGYCTHIQSWEFWNEVHAPADWVAEMAAYLKRIDPNKHLVTTTYGNPDVWALPDIDFAQEHIYGSPGNQSDAGQTIGDLVARGARAYGKPFLVGEFGIDWTSGDNQYDPNGRGTNMHNGMWAAMAGGAMGSAMIWYWNNYVHSKNLYHEFTALHAFVRDIPWADLNLQPVITTTPRSKSKSGGYDDLVLTPPMGWGRATGTHFRVRPDGSVTGGDFAGVLYSSSKPDLRRPPTFLVNYPTPGKFIVHVGRVASGAVLHIWLDGKEALLKQLPAGKGDGPWKESKHDARWNIWVATYDKDFAIDVPAGRHTIKLDNTGADWLTVDRYVFTGCKDSRCVALRVIGLRDDDFALLWIQNPASTWFNDQKGIEPKPVTDAWLYLQKMPDGEYEIQWWDTRTGRPTGSVTAVSHAGRLRLDLPPVKRDVACKVRRVR